MFTLDQFDYSLPPELIAQSPIEPRDMCRLLVLDRKTGEISHRVFRDIVELIDKDAILVRNNTKVLPARLLGKKDTGGKCEVLLVHQLESPDAETKTRWECLTKPGLKPNQQVTFSQPDSNDVHFSAYCSPESDFESYTRIVDFDCPEKEFFAKLLELGHTPLPPYITHAPKDEHTLREIYQTTYAKLSGSVAAPTAGMHFTPKLDQALRDKGVEIVEVTLHVGLGTFLPVQDDQLSQKRLHKEYVELSEETAALINSAKADGRNIVSVGTTTTRVLESCARDGILISKSGTTDLFIQPGDKYQIVDQLITNFHLPKSSLLMLLGAFVSAPNTSQRFTTFAESTAGKAYATAVQDGYRFFSFGDAMFVY